MSVVRLSSQQDYAEYFAFYLKDFKTRIKGNHGDGARCAVGGQVLNGPVKWVHTSWIGFKKEVKKFEKLRRPDFKNKLDQANYNSIKTQTREIIKEIQYLKDIFDTWAVCSYCYNLPDDL